MLFRLKVIIVTVTIVIAADCHYHYFIMKLNSFIPLLLSSLLPSLLVLLFFLLLLISVKLFVIISCFHCRYSYQLTLPLFFPSLGSLIS